MSTQGPIYDNAKTVGSNGGSINTHGMSDHARQIIERGIADGRRESGR